ncbi:(d)CMP kinase [Candidatus Omnitrophota bacterium]
MPKSKEKNSKITPKPIIITIDGPAGAGKSTIAKKVAAHLGFTYLDTGAMYRALTYKALKKKIDMTDVAELANLLSQTDIKFEADGQGKTVVIVDEEDVSLDIRTPEVTNQVFYIARAPEIRREMVRLQRKFAEKNNVVVEGRDIGTVVFPNADKKIYLDADFKERAKRRFKELKEKISGVSLEQVEKDVSLRDTSDFTREVGPLKQAEDAVRINTTSMTIDEVVREVVKRVEIKAKDHE